MNITCETPLYNIYPGGLEMALLLSTDSGPFEAEGMVTAVFRAYDGRLGVELQQPSGPGCVTPIYVPLENILGYRILEEDWDEDLEGDRAAFEALYEDEIDSLLNGTYEDSEGRTVPWEYLVEEERLARLAPSWPQWHENDELVIYLTLAASTKGEAEADLATRVGGALWAAIRSSNPERVKLARGLLGLSVSNERFVEAAEAIDPHNVARVASSAMFVGLGGEDGTEETMRLLTLLQVSSQVPRFF